jgi:hypothetical protein
MKNLLILIASLWLVSFSPHPASYTNSTYQETSALPRITISQATLKGQKDVAVYLQTRINSAAQNTAFILPEGEYNLLSPIVVSDKTISIIGGAATSGLKTIFRVRHAGIAFYFTREKIGSRAHIEKINIINGLNENNSFEQHGIVTCVPTVMEDVIVENMWGDGIRLSGDGGAGRGTITDVSFCKLTTVTVRSCKGDGIYITGGDANASIFTHIDVRDNEGHGIRDASFLGNTFVSCMAHNNYLGNYFVTDVNNRSTLTGCYSEGGSPYDYFYGQCQIFGGFLATGAVLSRNAVWYSYTADPNKPTIYRAPYDMDKHKVYPDGTVVTIKPDGTFPLDKDVRFWSKKK